MAEAGVLEMVELDLALDWAPGCDWAGTTVAGRYVSEPGCEREAEWIGKATCCGLVRFFCSEHRAARDEFVLTHPKVVHRRCGARGAPVAWSPLRGGA